MSDNLRDRIAAVLTEHQRQGAQHCLCGWGKLGHSHAEHQADAVIRELDSHGWLIDPESEEREWLRDKSRWLKGEDE